MPTTSIRERVLDSWAHTTRVLRFFRSMFISQYLLSLRERHRFDHPQPRVISAKRPAVGDYVQLKGDTNNRTHWAVGRISALPVGLDGQIRTAHVTLPNGHVLTRSIGHLYPLELDVSMRNPVSNDAPADADNSVPPPSPHPHLSSVPASESHTSLPTAERSEMSTVSTPAPTLRPRRSAALAARDRWRDWIAAMFSALVSASR